MNYESYLTKKSQLSGNHGFKPIYLPDSLFDFQLDLVDWSVNKGRCAIFADCGMGKTLMQLVFAENIVRHTNKNVLILTPLAVSGQTVLEAEKFGIECHKSRNGEVKGKITVTNYEQLHKFDSNDFIGVICDESSILKSYKGSLRKEITLFMRKIPYRLLATATPSPNDYIELGTSSEALGYLGAMDMLNKFFKNDQNNSKVGRFRGETVKWRLKGHAEIPFWRWVCSWARAVRMPSDLGYENHNFILPELIENEHMVEAKSLPFGQLFALPACGLKEQREERRRTIEERCEAVADIVNNSNKPSIVWCHLNDEGDLLEKIIPDGVQVSGKDNEDKQEQKFLSFAKGSLRVLITKPQIGAWGLNFQHCAHMTFFPSHSFEQYYQGIRRCWRFGQNNTVVVDVITTEGEGQVMKNLQRKALQAEVMFSTLVKEMNNALHINKITNFNNLEVIPPWL